MLQGSTKEVEPWYKTPYSLSKISPDWMKQWSAAADTQLFLPELNPFIPSNFKLIKVHLLHAPAESQSRSPGLFADTLLEGSMRKRQD